jgi:hypothetical protein
MQKSEFIFKKSIRDLKLQFLVSIFNIISISISIFHSLDDSSKERIFFIASHVCDDNRSLFFLHNAFIQHEKRFKIHSRT